MAESEQVRQLRRNLRNLQAEHDGVERQIIKHTQILARKKDRIEALRERLEKARAALAQELNRDG